MFGSTSPPSAANGQVVFAGFDNEEAPTLGGIYLAPLAQTPDTHDPRQHRRAGSRRGESTSTFNGLGEGGAFDGRYVGFWGAWGTETRTVRLYCPTEGNKDRIAYCNRESGLRGHGETGRIRTASATTTGCYQDKQVPVHQGIFVHDTANGKYADGGEDRGEVR